MIVSENQSDSNYYLINPNENIIGIDNLTNFIKVLIYPTIPLNLYGITLDGRIYSFINDTYISWSIRNNLPYVNLTSISTLGTHLEPFYIKDLMAYNFIANAKNYLERGFHSTNIDGDTMNCKYSNIRYINSSII